MEKETKTGLEGVKNTIKRSLWQSLEELGVGQKPLITRLKNAKGQTLEDSIMEQEVICVRRRGVKE